MKPLNTRWLQSMHTKKLINILRRFMKPLNTRWLQSMHKLLESLQKRLEYLQKLLQSVLKWLRSILNSMFNWLFDSRQKWFLYWLCLFLVLILILILIRKPSLLDSGFYLIVQFLLLTSLMLIRDSIMRQSGFESMQKLFDSIVGWWFKPYGRQNRIRFDWGGERYTREEGGWSRPNRKLRCRDLIEKSSRHEDTLVRVLVTNSFGEVYGLYLDAENKILDINNGLCVPSSLELDPRWKNKITITFDSFLESNSYVEMSIESKPDDTSNGGPGGPNGSPNGGPGGQTPKRSPNRGPGGQTPNGSQESKTSNGSPNRGPGGQTPKRSPIRHTPNGYTPNRSPNGSPIRHTTNGSPWIEIIEEIIESDNSDYNSDYNSHDNGFPFTEMIELPFLKGIPIIDTSNSKGFPFIHGIPRINPPFSNTSNGSWQSAGSDEDEESEEGDESGENNTSNGSDQSNPSNGSQEGAGSQENNTSNGSDQNNPSNESQEGAGSQENNTSNGSDQSNPSIVSDPDETSNGSEENNSAWSRMQKYKHLWVQCDNEECSQLNYKKFLKERLNICEHCGYHLKMSSSERIELLIDPGTWYPMDEDMVSLDPLGWGAEKGLAEKELAEKELAERELADRELAETMHQVAEHIYQVTGVRIYQGRLAEEEPSQDRLAEEELAEEEPYQDRLDSYQNETGLTEAVQTGVGQLNGIHVAIGVMDFQFMGGSMGSVVGEKITRLIEYATNQFLPLILVCASGGARMQEGSLSLMQMAKISSALYNFQSIKKLFYVSILTSPTAGGVTASFGMLGDIIIAEPNCYIAFAGKRVIEQLLNIIVPEGVQEAEYLFEKGSLDLIVPRNLLKSVLIELFKFHELYRTA